MKRPDTNQDGDFQLIVMHTRFVNHKQKSNMNELWSRNLGALQEFCPMVSLLTSLVAIWPGRFWSVSKMFLLESFGHDPPIEAADAGAIRPANVALHRERSIVPHPPKGLKHLKGQACSDKLVWEVLKVFNYRRGMGVLRILYKTIMFLFSCNLRPCSLFTRFLKILGVSWDQNCLYLLPIAYNSTWIDMHVVLTLFHTVHACNNWYTS